jgi:hypothetical protein
VPTTSNSWSESEEIGEFVVVLLDFLAVLFFLQLAILVLIHDA